MRLFLLSRLLLRDLFLGHFLLGCLLNNLLLGDFLGSLLDDILRVAKVEESRELARTVQSRLCYYIKTEDRGVKRAPFIVLIGAKAPSVLVELGILPSAE